MISAHLNLNGSSADDLIKPRRAAMYHLMDAIEALRDATPNGRDYPGNRDGLNADREAHFDRLDRLHTLREELMAEALYIKEQQA